MVRKAKEKQYQRKRRKCTFTLSDQAREFLKKNVTNASRFIERLLEDAEKGIKGAYVTVSPIGGQIEWARRGLNPRPPGYEPGALTGLSYGPKNCDAAGLNREMMHSARISGTSRNPAGT